MTELRVTNHYDRGTASKNIQIRGNVEISNYKTGEKRPTGYLYANINNGKVNIEQKNGNKDSLDFNKEKYSLFLKIASMDGRKNELSVSDITNVSRENLGLDNSYVVKKDPNAGIVNVYKKEGNQLKTYLHIDFETKSEKAAASSAPKTSSKQEARLNPTKNDTIYWGKQPIKVQKNKDGSETYIIPNQPYGEDGAFFGYVSKRFTVKNGIVVKEEIYYTHENSLSNRNRDISKDKGVDKIISTYDGKNTRKISRYYSQFSGEYATYTEVKPGNTIEMKASTLQKGNFRQILDEAKMW